MHIPRSLKNNFSLSFKRHISQNLKHNGCTAIKGQSLALLCTVVIMDLEGYNIGSNILHSIYIYIVYIRGFSVINSH